MATGDWVLSVDADERVTPALAAEIRRVIADPRLALPRLPRADPQRDPRAARSASPGRSTTTRCGSSAATRADGSDWSTRRSTCDGPAGAVSGELRHRTIPTMRRSSTRSTLHDAGGRGPGRRERRPFRLGDLTVRPVWTFFKLYVFKQGFRDGVEGFMFCLFSGVSVAVRAWKHRELTLARRAS